MTFGEPADIHLRNLDENLSVKPRTREYWREVLFALLKSWPGLRETELRKITQSACKKWARDYAKTAPSTRYHNTIAILRHVLNVAIGHEDGAALRHENLRSPAAGAQH